MYWFKPRNRKKHREEAQALGTECPPQEAKADHSAKPGRDLPRFRNNARHQFSPHETSKADRLRIKFRGAFTPAQPVEKRERFAGRTKALARLISGIEDQRLHAVIYGDRGIGKTSLLHVLAETAREAGYVVLYESCDAGTGFDELFRSVLGRIPQLYHGGITPADEAVEEGATLLDMAGPAMLSPRSVSELLAATAGARLILMLDEFDRATSREFRRAVAELIKNLSDRCARVQIVVAGVAANFAELVEHIPSIRRNVLSLELPRMDDEEIEEMIAIGEAESGIAFGVEARSSIRFMAHGYPYIAALLSHHAGLSAIDKGADEVSLYDVTVAAEELDRHIDVTPNDSRPMVPASGQVSAGGL